MWQLQQRLVEQRAVLVNRIPTRSLLRAAVPVVQESKRDWGKVFPQRCISLHRTPFYGGQ